MSQNKDRCWTLIRSTALTLIAAVRFSSLQVTTDPIRMYGDLDKKSPTMLKELKGHADAVQSVLFDPLVSI